MEPPWIRYPAIPLGSIGWRMGAGEDYWYVFQKWFGSQEPAARAAFQASWPEPPRWEGFYTRAFEQHRAMTERGPVAGLTEY